MKACSQCGATYSDRIEFCFVDGVVLDVSAVAPTASGAADPWDVPSAASFDLPAPPPQVHQAALVPTPLAPFALPLKQVTSPLNVAPPPPVAPAAETQESAQIAPVADTETSPPAADVPTAVSAETPVAPAPVQREAATASPAQDNEKAIPAWVWWAGLGVAAVLFVGAMLFAAGSLGVLGAAATRSKAPQNAEVVVESEPPSSTAAAGGQATATPPADTEPDDDRFPAEPLEIGVVAVDDDALQPTSNDTPAPDPGTALDGANIDSIGSDPAPSTSGQTEPSAPPLVVGTQVDPLTTPDTPPSTPGAGAADAALAVPPADGPWDSPPAPAAPDNTAAADPPVQEPIEEEPPPPANAGTVMVFLQGQAEGLQLIVDGRLRRGTFPHTLQLAPGSHRFRVQDKSGKGYEIGQTITFQGRKAARVMLIAP